MVTNHDQPLAIIKFSYWWPAAQPQRQRGLELPLRDLPIGAQGIAMIHTSCQTLIMPSAPDRHIPWCPNKSVDEKITSYRPWFPNDYSTNTLMVTLSPNKSPSDYSAFFRWFRKLQQPNSLVSHSACTNRSNPRRAAGVSHFHFPLGVQAVADRSIWWPRMPCCDWEFGSSQAGNGATNMAITCHNWDNPPFVRIRVLWSVWKVRWTSMIFWSLITSPPSLNGD